METVLAPPDARTRVDRPLPVRRSTPAVPRLLFWTSVVVVVAGATMALLGALRTGISWDEPFHVMRLRNYLNHGWFALDWTISTDDAGGSSSGSSESNTMVYGPVTMLLLHTLAVVFGVEHWNSVSATPAAYELRHVGVALIGLAGTAAAAAITRILLGSWRWALVTAAALLALPMWTGHLMFNIKDVPVATGYTVTTLALISMVAPVRSNRLLRISGLVAGIVLMVGTRPAMTSALVIALVVLLAGVLGAGRFGHTRTALTEAATGVLGSVLVLVAIYPKLFAHPLNLVASTDQSVDFHHGQDAVWGYIPFHVLAQVPLLLQVFFVVGLLAVARLCIAHWRTDAAQMTQWALVGAQLLALPLVAMAKHSDLYNGLRQLLFVSPAWAIIATAGLAKALSWGKQTGRLRLVGGVAVVALVAPMLDQFSLFPYQYTYYNEALDATGVHVPSDYWRVSVPELMPRVPTDGQIICAPSRVTSTGALAGTPAGDAVPPESLIASRYSSDSSVDCRIDPLGPLAPSWAEQGLSRADRLPHNSFYVLIDRDHQVPSNCHRLVSVDRERHGRTISMSYLARCHLAPQELGATPVTFTRLPNETMTANQWGYAPVGWVSRDSTSAIDAEGRTASLTFRAADACRDVRCTLVVDVTAPDDLTVTVNDEPARAQQCADQLNVALPRGFTTAWVSFSRDSGAPVDLRVHGIRVVQQNAAQRPTESC